MTGFITPDEASTDYFCPLARTFAKKDRPFCMGSDCILWRWRPLSADDPRFQSAIKREMACLAQDAEKEDGKKRQSMAFHKQAVANVMANPEGHGAPAKPEKGYCGLGAEPKA